MRMDGSLCLQRANPAPYRLSACDVGELFRELWRRRCCDDAQLPLRVCCIPQPLGSRMLTSFILLLILIPFLWHCTRLHIEIKWIFVCVLMKVFNKLKNQGNIWAVLAGQRPSSDFTLIDQDVAQFSGCILENGTNQRTAPIRGWNSLPSSEEFEKGKCK